MVNPPQVKTGEIWLASLDPAVGSEIQKTRPCVLVSPPEMHDFLRVSGFRSHFRASPA
jgi:mRNA interferase MazF